MEKVSTLLLLAFLSAALAPDALAIIQIIMLAPLLSILKLGFIIIMKKILKYDWVEFDHEDC